MDSRTKNSLVKNACDEKGDIIANTLSQGELAKYFKCSRNTIINFLRKKNVPWYCLGKRKRYFLSEVLEEVDKTKWASNIGDD